MSAELREAFISALAALDRYLMANWDEQERRLVRQEFAKVRALLVAEGKR